MCVLMGMKMGLVVRVWGVGNLGAVRNERAGLCQGNVENPNKAVGDICGLKRPPISRVLFPLSHAGLTVGLFLFKKMKRKRQQPKTETMPHAVGNHGSFSSSKLKFGILGCLYFAQGLPFGFQTKALPVYLRYHARSPPFPFFFTKVYRTRACGRVVAHARPAHDY